ncbi:SPW repeat domain-containing protein [Microvirga guangxiensis]|uniref:SPW repeat-containing protein n=1 Tax=Microvirga guangxiensis TaxID=549386 RepID=A0A1G5KCS0_9HYPH|nr:SPW repeat protein [Microvirga guangxiensis]SCY98224.1 SPW repeat-containing protein [Microvirga guangxiensis]
MRISPPPKIPVIGYSVLGAAALLFVVPWAPGLSAEAVPAWSLWAVAALTAACGAYAVLVARRQAAWALLALVAWLFVAPWMLGFTASVMAFWAHVAASLGLAALATAIGWQSSKDDTSVAA